MEREFQCDICELKFPFMSKLERHMNLHTGEKQYQCDVCEFKTAHKYNLSAHQKAVHMGQKPYQCSLCGLGFNRRNELTKHQQLKHMMPMIPGENALANPPISVPQPILNHQRISEIGPSHDRLTELASHEMVGHVAGE